MSASPSKASDASSKWLWRSRPGAAPRVRLICVPYAGGGAASFRTWPAKLPADVELLAIQLPGRGMRMGEPLLRRVEQVVDAVGPLLTDSPVPFVLFGHSMGAILSFNLCRWLRNQGHPLPARLIVSGHRAPNLPDPEPPKHHLSDAALLDRIRRYGGTPEEILREPELMELMLPILRADFELLGTHAYTSAAPLPVPLLALGGADDPNAPPDTIEAWREHAAGEFSSRIFPGGHFFLHTEEAAVLPVIAEEIAKVRSPAAAPV
ncbi:thioesterase II family protein [Chondromyces apiculatus]|nr:alpha/beta fold hydrolase [Chondromyces apiculatus]